MKIRTVHDINDIAELFIELGHPNELHNAEFWEEHSQELKDIETALYNLKAICENEHNSDYYRTLWNVLQTACDYGFLWKQ